MKRLRGQKNAAELDRIHSTVDRALEIFEAARDAANTVFAAHSFPEIHGLGHELRTFTHEGGIGCGHGMGREDLDNVFEEGMTFTLAPAIITSRGRLCQEEVVTLTPDGSRFLSTPQSEVWTVR